VINIQRTDVAMTEVRYTVTEDDLTFMGLKLYEANAMPPEPDMTTMIEAEFAAWKQVVRPEGN